MRYYTGVLGAKLRGAGHFSPHSAGGLGTRLMFYFIFFAAKGVRVAVEGGSRLEMGTGWKITRLTAFF